MSRGIVHLSTVHRTRDNRIYNKECRALLDAGEDLTLVIRGEGDEDSPVPIRSLPIPRSRLGRLTLTQWRAWRTLDGLRPRLLHIHDPELIPMALAWGRLRQAAVVFDAHEDLVKQVETKPYLRPWQRRIARSYARFLTRLADRHMDGVVAATEDIAAGFSHPNTQVVFNYPWLSDFSPVPAPESGRMVYTGDLTQERKLSFMIDVAGKVREVVPEAHLVLAGALGKGMGTVAERFDGDLVRYVGLLAPVDLPALIGSAEAGLIFLEPKPNYLNSLPTKLFEYQAAGVPVVASDFPVWQARFGSAGSVLFVDSDDVEMTAAAVAGLLRDPRRRAEMSAAGRRAIEREFNFESQTDALLGVVGRASEGV